MWTSAGWRSPRRGPRAGPRDHVAVLKLAAADLGGRDVDVPLGIGVVEAQEAVTTRGDLEHAADRLGRWLIALAPIGLFAAPAPPAAGIAAAAAAAAAATCARRLALLLAPAELGDQLVPAEHPETIDPALGGELVELGEVLAGQ